MHTFFSSFLSAGSDIIETVTYQASVDGFMTHLNLTEKEALALIGKGVQVALDVRAEFWQDHPEDHNGMNRFLVIFLNLSRGNLFRKLICLMCLSDVG